MSSFIELSQANMTNNTITKKPLITKQFVTRIFLQLYCHCIWLSICASLLLWGFSEAGFYGGGIFRQKYMNETCGWDISRKCIDGLYCVNRTCISPPQNITIVNEICDSPPPQNCPPQTINKIVSYFDYIDHLNKYLIPMEGENNLMNVTDVDYGACKELCSREKYCRAICYYGDQRTCYLRYTKGSRITEEGGNFWTCAIKT